MAKSTEQLIKIFEELKIKYKVDEKFAEDMDVLSVRMKQSNSFTDFAIFSSGNQPDVSIQAVVGKTTPGQRPICLEILNELHQEHKWIKYTIDDKNLICARIDTVITDKSLPSIVFQLLCCASDFVLQCKNVLSESGVCECVNNKKT